MKEEYTLSEFVEEIGAKNPVNGLKLLSKLLELEHIDNWLNVMYGIELDIKVKPAEKKIGRWYGKELLESIDSANTK